MAAELSDGFQRWNASQLEHLRHNKPVVKLVSQVPNIQSYFPANLSIETSARPLKGEFKKLRPVSLTPRFIAIHRGVGRGLRVLTLSKGFHRAANRFRAFLNS